MKTEGQGRTVDEWTLRPEQSDNNWLDRQVGSGVAAPTQGVVLFGTGIETNAETAQIANLEQGTFNRRNSCSE